ncbi:MAG: hypothetical protein ABI543_04160 [Ignavibacteria bacterium]
MIKYILVLNMLLVSAMGYSQSTNLPLKLKNNHTFRSFFTPGIGINFEKRNGWNNSFNISVELDIHTGKGFFTGGGLLNHPVPSNPSNKLTYLYVLERKGFYLFDNFAIYGGIGGSIGVSTKGHPGCCVGGIYFSILTSYDLQRFISVGLEGKVITDFSVTSLIPGIQFILRL